MCKQDVVTWMENLEEFEFDSDAERVYVQIENITLIIVKTHEGVIVDAWGDQRDSESLATLAVEFFDGQTVTCPGCKEHYPILSYDSDYTCLQDHDACVSCNKETINGERCALCCELGHGSLDCELLSEQ